jgi:hypothetical protein
MAFADGHAGSDRSDPDAYLVRKGRSSQSGNSSNHQSVFHRSVLFIVKVKEKFLARLGVPAAKANCRRN